MNKERKEEMELKMWLEDEEVYFSLGAITDEKAREALEFLFDTCASEEQVKQVKKFIKSKFERINCAVLYCINNEFMSLCSQIALPVEKIGKREVTINSEGQVIKKEDFSCGSRKFMRKKNFNSL